MIAKHVPMKTLKKSDFAGLVAYLADPQDKLERVGYVKATHCQSEDPRDAVLEIQAKQAQNQRALSDKTYHLILSFRAGENPPPEVLEAIEARICAGLGYGEHQRVSAVHHDTDHLHIHIAINKIHPRRLTLHTPYNDHKTLGNLCEALEAEYGLAHDNHRAQKRGAENRAADMEHAAGLESLLGWIQRECLVQLQGAQSWPALHQALNDHGLMLQERGNGLIITDQAGIRVKASSVDRDLSMPKLEARLGPFEAGARKNEPPVRQYQAKPLAAGVNTAALFARYEAEQQANAEARTLAWVKAREKKNRLIEGAKGSGRLKRSAIRLMGGGRMQQKALYALASRGLREEVQRIQKQYRAERQAIYDGYPRRAWSDWLRQQATAGDAEALAALRARVAREAVSGDTVSGPTLQDSAPPSGVVPDSVTRQGTIIYRVGSAVVRDDGERLHVSRALQPEDLAAALRLAVHRYGERLSVNGSDAFKAWMVQAAAEAKLGVRFDDEAMEQRRRALLRAVAEPVRGSADLAESPPSSAADRYIAERESKRRLGMDVPLHRHWQGEGQASYAGSRQVGDQTVALLRRGEEIQVLSVDAATARRLKRLGVGDPLTVTSNGSIRPLGQTRSRSR